MGLEWLFRLLIEPKRLFKRYFEVVPKYIYYNIIEFLNFVFKKREV
jgi:N-acetylglucosaminyldiphosphoundecaprenol N-acetyl-beta-D-mannosaminyltransferase